MSLYESREQKKWAAARRAQLALKHAMERIDYAEDVIKPELEAMSKGELALDSTGDNATDAKAALSTPEDESESSK